MHTKQSFLFWDSKDNRAPPRRRHESGAALFPRWRWVSISAPLSSRGERRNFIWTARHSNRARPIQEKYIPTGCIVSVPFSCAPDGLRFFLFEISETRRVYIYTAKRTRLLGIRQSKKASILQSAQQQRVLGYGDNNNATWGSENRWSRWQRRKTLLFRWPRNFCDA